MAIKKNQAYQGFFLSNEHPLAVKQNSCRYILYLKQCGRTYRRWCQTRDRCEMKPFIRRQFHSTGQCYKQFVEEIWKRRFHPHLKQQLSTVLECILASKKTFALQFCAGSGHQHIFSCVKHWPLSKSGLDKLIGKWSPWAQSERMLCLAYILLYGRGLRWSDPWLRVHFPNTNKEQRFCQNLKFVWTVFKNKNQKRLKNKRW